LRRSPWVFGTFVAAALGFLVVTSLVALRVSQPLDEMLVAWFRPDDGWGTEQVVLEPVIDALGPRRMFVLLGLAGVVASLREVSWRPIVFVALLAVAAVAHTLVAKYALHRPDPHLEMTGMGGSYPSGHMVAVLACLGGCVLLLRRRPHKWPWLVVGMAATLMGAALLFTAAHWPTDVVGGGMLGLTLLAGAVALAPGWVEPRSAPTES
jgi:membrane-associated phospholipid phosphatase